jgi:CheY-like chemotaxis protein
LARIYVFEDDTSLRGLLVELLHDELQADVVACTRMPELRQRCLQQRPDLIVADFWGTSHLELDDTERDEIVELAAIAPLVLVSARNWALGAEPDELGVAALLPKPLDIERFAAVVQSTLASGPQPNVFVLGWPHG